MRLPGELGSLGVDDMGLFVNRELASLRRADLEDSNRLDGSYLLDRSRELMEVLLGLLLRPGCIHGRGVRTALLLYYISLRLEIFLQSGLLIEWLSCRLDVSKWLYMVLGRRSLVLVLTIARKIELHCWLHISVTFVCRFLVKFPVISSGVECMATLAISTRVSCVFTVHLLEHSTHLW